MENLFLLDVFHEGIRERVAFRSLENHVETVLGSSGVEYLDCENVVHLCEQLWRATFKHQAL